MHTTPPMSNSAPAPTPYTECCTLFEQLLACLPPTAVYRHTMTEILWRVLREHTAAEAASSPALRDCWARRFYRHGDELAVVPAPYDAEPPEAAAGGPNPQE